MYRVSSRGQLEFPNFYLPFAGELDPDNRWIALARLVPWELADEIYRESLCGDFGAPALAARVALGALLIKERLGLTDRETVEAIRENPYLQFIDRLLETPGALRLPPLSRRHDKDLLVCREVCRQQLQMYETKTHRIDDRIVSLSQPHVRPIKRGKAGRDTEFGAKLSISVIGGFSFVDRLSWDNYHESLDLVGQIETFRRRLGFYPASVPADKIYRTRANRKSIASSAAFV